MDLKQELERAAQKLDAWIEQNGWAGYDPYDIKGTKLFLRFWKYTYIRHIMSGAAKLFPLPARKLMGVPREVNAKAMGLFADGYLNLWKATENPGYKKKSAECLAWLETHYAKGYSGYCWGYPFDWQSKIFIPKGTPCAVVSAVCGNAFWNWYEHTRDARYLTICKSICNFFIRDLHRDEFSGDRVCFSYTPLDHFHIHNANLFVAEFLIKIGKETNNRQFADYGMQAARFTLGEQNSDGSLCYWARDQEKKCSCDHYHLGFEMRSLYSIWQLTKEEEVYGALRRSYAFYLEQFFADKTTPLLFPSKRYPVDIHAAAEAILCTSLLGRDFPEGKEYRDNVLRWTIEHMQQDEGWFIFKIENIFGFSRRVKIPYIRWGQAWMLSALSHASLSMSDG